MMDIIYANLAVLIYLMSTTLLDQTDLTETFASRNSKHSMFYREDPLFV